MSIVQLTNHHQGCSYENGRASTRTPYSSCGVQRVRGTEGTVTKEYGFKYGGRRFFQVRGTRRTEYEKYRLLGVRILVRMTAIFLSTKYEEHGVREVLIFESTNFVRSTEYF